MRALSDTEEENLQLRNYMSELVSSTGEICLTSARQALRPAASLAAETADTDGKAPNAKLATSAAAGATAGTANNAQSTASAATGSAAAPASNPAANAAAEREKTLQRLAAAAAAVLNAPPHGLHSRTLSPTKSPRALPGASASPQHPQVAAHARSQSQGTALVRARTQAPKLREEKYNLLTSIDDLPTLAAEIRSKWHNKCVVRSF
mgnify:CR=1 FL=1